MLKWRNGFTALAGLALALFCGPAAADSPIVNPSFEQGLSGWNTYTYENPPNGEPGAPYVGTLSNFFILPPPNVPDGSRICGSQCDEVTQNGGVYQQFYWTGQQATIFVTARAYSEKFPYMGSGPYDNGCRVRMALANAATSERPSQGWVTFDWGPDWNTRSVTVPGPGSYTLFIETVQPDGTVLQSTAWDNVVFSALPLIQCVSQLPIVPVIPGNPGYPDSSVKIEWQTNVASTSKVEYGLTSSYGGVAEDTQLVTNHSVTITGLTPSRTYHFRVSSSASGYVTWRSDDYTFKTPIQFSDVTASVGSDGLSTVIMWTTDRPCTSQVEYGETASYGYITAEDPNLVTQHSVSISGLQEDHEYHFRVKGRNPPLYSDAVSGDYTFTTLPLPGTSLRNPSFEQGHGSQSPSLYPWVQYTTIRSPDLGQRPIDGIIGPYPASGPLSWYKGFKAQDGSYFVGAGSQMVCKNGGVMQRIFVTPGELYTFGVHYATHRTGGTNNDCRIRLGIDPDGGVDPANVSFWSTYSPTNDSQWHWTTVSARAGSGGVATVFLDFYQGYDITWNVIAVDNAKFGSPQVMSIGQLKKQADPLSAVFEDKIVTRVEPSSVSYNGVPYTKAYVQEANRSAGIAVLFDLFAEEQPQVGDKVTLTGSLVKMGMEATVVAHEWEFDRGPYELPKPLGLVQRALGGIAANQPELYGRGGPSNIGLRVTVFGKVNAIDWDNISFSEANAYIDDGSGLLDHQPEPPDEPVYGVRVKLLDNYSRAVKVGDYLAVTGVLTLPYLDPDGYPLTGDEFYAYSVLTNGPEDWTILRSQ